VQQHNPGEVEVFITAYKMNFLMNLQLQEFWQSHLLQLIIKHVFWFTVYCNQCSHTVLLLLHSVVKHITMLLTIRHVQF